MAPAQTDGPQEVSITVDLGRAEGVQEATKSSYSHAGWCTDVPQVLAGAVDAEILVFLQARIPLLPLAFSSSLALSFLSLCFGSLSLQGHSRVFGFA